MRDFTVASDCSIKQSELLQGNLDPVNTEYIGASLVGAGALLGIITDILVFHAPVQTVSTAAQRVSLSCLYPLHNQEFSKFCDGGAASRLRLSHEPFKPSELSAEVADVVSMKAEAREVEVVA